MGIYGTANQRWAGVGPYYAMFPTAFADEVVERYTSPGDPVLDPFAGRGTAVFSAASRNRPSEGIDVSPLGYVYANAKLNPGSFEDVSLRLREIEASSERYHQNAEDMPAFFHYCFSERVRRFLLAARSELDWMTQTIDRTLMALIAIYLHGKRGQSLSNQMRQTTSMAPDYAVRWWNERHLDPPDINVGKFLDKRIRWRYVHGVPDVADARSALGDSQKELPRLASDIQKGKRPGFKLLFTSPPYRNVTNYYYDQWLRVWLLGGPERPTGHSGIYGGKFSGQDQYHKLLRRVFGAAKQTLDEDAVIYVRAGRRRDTLDAIRTTLQSVFTDKSLTEDVSQMNPSIQMKPYSRGGAPKRISSEVDLILCPG